MLTKFGVAVLIFGGIRPPKYVYKQPFSPAGRHDSRINVTFGTAEGTEDHSIRWHCATNKRPAGDALPSR